MDHPQLKPQSMASHVQATYNSPNEESRVFNQALPATTTSPSTEERTQYLTALRAGVIQIQSEINIFLTTKMEEDKAKAGQAALNDEKEEENYGEEKNIQEARKQNSRRRKEQGDENGKYE